MSSNLATNQMLRYNGAGFHYNQYFCWKVCTCSTQCVWDYKRMLVLLETWLETIICSGCFHTIGPSITQWYFNSYKALLHSHQCHLCHCIQFHGSSNYTFTSHITEHPIIVDEANETRIYVLEEQICMCYTCSFFHHRG